MNITVICLGKLKEKYLTDAERERAERAFAERCYLSYFNKFLLDSGTISKKEYALMSEKIEQRCAARTRSKSSR